MEKETNFRFVYFTKKKNGTETVLPLFVLDANRIFMQIGPYGTAFTIHGDNGAEEYRSDAVMKALLVALNGTLNTCPPHTPEKNGLAERQWGIVIPAANCAINNIPGTAPRNLWSYAVSYITHIINITPSPVLDNRTSYELVQEISGRKTAIPDMHIYKFGALAYMHLEKSHRENGPMAPNEHQTAQRQYSLAYVPILFYYMGNPGRPRYSRCSAKN